MTRDIVEKEGNPNTPLSSPAVQAVLLITLDDSNGLLRDVQLGSCFFCFKI